jgi:hypothetical protein
MSKNQRGFTVVEVFLVLAITLAIGGVGLNLSFFILATGSKNGKEIARTIRCYNLIALDHLKIKDLFIFLKK